jgi:hypothetical protein
LKKITGGKKFDIFLSKITISLSLGLHKGCPSYRRSLQPQKRTSGTSKHAISSLFPIFVRKFCPPGSGSGIEYGFNPF